MENSLVHIVDFHTALRGHVAATNQILAQSFPQDNIAYAVDNLEFTLPLREISREGRTELFVLLSGQIEPTDRFFRVKIIPELLLQEKPHQNSVSS